MDVCRLLSTPTRAAVDLGDGRGWIVADPAAGGFSSRGVEIGCAVVAGRLAIEVAAPAVPVCAVQLRWELPVPRGVRLLGDHWERGYGDLEWRGLVAERVMPWYVLVQDGDRPAAFGVMTGAASLAHWTVDAAGVSLILDLRCGGLGVALGSRRLRAAEVAVRQGVVGEDAHTAAHAFCRSLCPKPLLPAQPVYGLNDWYYAYGRNSADSIARDGDRLAAWTQGLVNRPFLVIDAGWYGEGACCGGPWLPNARFGDMAEVAARQKRLGLRPGLWYRPLTTHGDVPATRCLPRRGGESGREAILDPSCPENLRDIAGTVASFAAWGYELVKHDFSTFDLCDKWGMQMGGRMTHDGWAFADRSRTTAEIIVALYRAIRQGAGPAAVLGCNVIGHLAAGLVELQRTGDDTSGRNWERTRKMGLNTLAMRMPQHNAFFAVDADCVGLTRAVPWELNRRWLDVLARSGTPLFISPAPDALGPEQEAAIREAFARASRPAAVSRALDWQETTAPTHWRDADGERRYGWDDALGAAAACPL